ncbi:hypothetical protein [Novosphingobium lentum]|uniref:hypothetical protein n=1 Tax=Novosphingobium lentum TaxID=145287 RepID=UPI000836EF50|nr:hypothetical protein [Novosphingobium lentum]
MSMHFRELAKQAAADRAITAEEILGLRREGWADGVFETAEADALFAINDLVADRTPEWVAFFVEALCDYVVNGTAPRGYVDDATANWLIEHMDRDGRLDSVAELELLVRIVERALVVPDGLKAYALQQIELAVTAGTDPTRGSGASAPGSITATSAALLRRMIFASGGDRPAAVSRVEAELLFRLKDATLGGDNAPEWQALFVQGVGNYLLAYSSYAPFSRERAAELESFMDQPGSGIGGFFGRMAKSDLGGTWQGLFGRKPLARDREAEYDTAHAIDSDETRWLDQHIHADGQIDALEQALLDFIAEETKG